MVFIYGLYIDSFFLMNVLMDGMALYLTGVLLKYRIKRLRIIAACMGAGLITVILFLLLRSYLIYQLIVHLMVNPLMLLMAFGRRHIPAFLKSWIFCYVFVMLSGGCMQWMNQTVFYGEHMEICMFLTFCLGLSIALVFEKQWFARRNLYHITLWINGKSLQTEAYYDTGNLLSDPFVKEPVQILNRKLAESFLREGNEAIRLIPFHSLGQRKGLLETVTVEQLCIEVGKEKVCIAPAVIGLANEELFSKKEYQMILNYRSMLHV